MIGGKVMVVGLRDKDWPDLRTQTNRLVFVSSDFAALRRQQKAGLPKGVEAVVMTKFISHTNTHFLSEAKQQGVRVYPVMGTGEARKLVIELLGQIRYREQRQLPPPRLVAEGGTVGIAPAPKVDVSLLPPLDVIVAANSTKEAAMSNGSGPTAVEFVPGLGRTKSALRIWVDQQVTGVGTLREEAKRLIDAGVKAGAVPTGYGVPAMQNMVARARRAKGLKSGPARGGRRTVRPEAAVEAPVVKMNKAGLAGQLLAMAQGLQHLAKDVAKLEATAKQIEKLRGLLK